VLIDNYLVSQENKLAASYLDSQRTHLRHLARHLGARADLPSSCISFHDLDGFIAARLKTREANTVVRERITLLQFFKWLVQQKHLNASPAAELEPIKGGGDLPPFRTVAEVERILERGGLCDREQDELWDCLYLNPREIANLLRAVRQNAVRDVSYLLHAIPAYSGMRRGEVLRLKWIDLDFEQDFITARSRKQSRHNRPLK
jgi:site-specific recombinase XerD